jgi:hypothetical protein
LGNLEEYEEEDEQSRASIGYNEEIFSPHHREDERTVIVDNTENDYYKNKMFSDLPLKQPQNAGYSNLLNVSGAGYGQTSPRGGAD